MKARALSLFLVSRLGMGLGMPRDNITKRTVSVPDLNATIAHALGLPLEQKVVSPSGRPFTLADKGKPIMDMFA